MEATAEPSPDPCTASTNETSHSTIEHMTTADHPAPLSSPPHAGKGAVNAPTANNGDVRDPSLDHSNRKIMVQGVHKFHDTKAITKEVDKWLIEMNGKMESADTTTTTSTTPVVPVVYDKIKKPPKKSWFTLTLQTEAMVQPFLAYVNNANIRTKKGDRLFAKRAAGDNRDDDNERSNNRGKRSRGGDDRGDGSKRQRDGGDERETKAARRPVTEEEMKDKITPLWKQSLEKQLITKMREMVKKCVMKITQELKQKFRTLNNDRNRAKMEVYPWILAKRGVSVDQIVSAPTPLRNKIEFTFGYRYLFDDDSTSKDVTVDASVDATIDTTGKAGDEAAASAATPIDEAMDLDEKKSDELAKAAGNAAAAAATMMDTTETKSEAKNGPSATAVEPRKVPAIGFMATGWAGGVSFFDSLSNTPSECGALVKIFDEFLSTSPLVPYDAITHKGFWRILTVRTSRRTGECMLIIQHAPPAEKSGEQGDAVDVSKDFEIEKSRLLSVLKDAELPTSEGEAPLKVTSIFFQEFAGLSTPSPEHPVQHAYGKTCMTERLGKCTFQISPGAFFQVNTEGAELLYQLAVDKVKEVSEDPGKTVLFDVCCGTGTIGLTCLKEDVVGQVVGVDISKPAIEDAKKNAALNGFDSDSKTRFVAARAEQVLANELYQAKALDKTFVAVVDPAREGLHADVIKAIRSNGQIGRLVYVSCNPTASLPRDAALLCAPKSKKYTGRPFKISSASPVDMFPLTSHCEMVMTFDRLDDSEMIAEVKKKVEVPAERKDESEKKE